MQMLQIAIKDPKAEKLLYDLAEMDVIEILSAPEKTADMENPRKAGWAKGMFVIRPSFDDPIEEFKEYE